MPRFYYPPLPRYIKTVVFIDGAFLESIVRDSFPKKVLLLRPFLPKITQEFDLGGNEASDCLRTYYYDAVSETSLKDEKLEEKRIKRNLMLDYLEENCDKVDVRKGFVKVSSGDEHRIRQKGVDTMLSSDMALIAWMGKIERIILVAADGDYVPAVEVAKRAMTNVYLLSEKEKISPELKRIVDIYKMNLKDVISSSGHLHDYDKIAERGIIPPDLMNEKAL